MKVTANAAIVQRLHERDLTGHLLAKEPTVWTHISLPAIAEGDEDWLHSKGIFRRKAGFTTVLPPNSPSCYEGADNPSNHSGIFTVSSYHPGGVSVCFGDGNVKFISNNIDLLTWQALGSRGGAESMGQF